MNDDEYYNKLRELNNGLTRLLNDPHPGLYTWSSMVGEYIDKMYKLK